MYFIDYDMANISKVFVTLRIKNNIRNTERG